MTEPLLVDFYPDFYNEPKSEIKACDNLEFQKCRRFGVGYMGSKNQIVKKLIPQLPSAKYFIDLFAGGCAMTHGAMLSGKYERFIANDISDAPSLFLRAIKGEFKDEKRWISREMYKELYNSDPYIRYVWSFGNNGARYMYGRKIEPYKKAQHYAHYFKNFSLLDDFKNFDGGYSVKYIQQLEEVKRLKALNSIIGLNVNFLEISKAKYKELKLPKPSECVIYCDPPYFNCEGYGERKGKTTFNHAEFYDFCENLARLGYKVFISEYEMPKDRFKSVFSVAKRQQLNGKGARAIKQEHLFVPIV